MSERPTTAYKVLTAEQMTALEHDGRFAGAPVDLAALGDAVRWEQSRGGHLFPHIYGELPLSAVVAYGPLKRDDNGTVLLPVAG